ncbi:MAG: hypothetical protein MR639_02225 [Clostridium sp.]|uniref:AAA family ATPase n=1 Tax=Clostridium sp. TaxID=1506 RepID=UPI002A88D5A0|nr:hypothetical protein [Clostridium sp.]MDY5097952.1 hypothetical protein [Clostridium sp.]
MKDWHEVKTINDYYADECISALQKFIRRNMLKEACFIGYELYATSEELEEIMWQRLLIISIEDIGMSDKMANTIVQNMYQTSKIFDYKSPDRPMVFIGAIRYLCQCEKERSSCHLCSITKRRVRNHDKIEIPDFVYDMHTKKGRELGRGYDHFLEEGSKVYPHSDIDDTPLMEELKQWIEREKR